MSIYVNRVLNMKQIKAIGFDMDHTLVRYHSDKFEELTFHETIKKLIEAHYPAEIKNFKYDFHEAIRGLVVDKVNGNILKVSLYNKIKNAYHGTKQLTYKEQQKLYKSSSVDLREEDYSSVDTAFSIAYTVIYAQMIDLKKEKPELIPQSFSEISDDIISAVDMAHRDGSLKKEVTANLSKYIIVDPETVEVLERFVRYDKKLWVITNSDYNYTKALLDYSINPYLKNHKDWSELFEIVITLSAKPRFFTDKMPFLKVKPDGSLSNYDGKIERGIYQGGYAVRLQKDQGLRGDEILYLGDHIYGDILKLKKACDWRTALIVEEIDSEVKAYRATKSISIEIDKLMEEKMELERELDELYAKEHEFHQAVSKEEISKRFDQIEKIDKNLGKCIKRYEEHFNPKWGEVMRAGAEPSQFAAQVERYACVYMSKISDFKDFGPRFYFRPKKRHIAHEL